jgi:hypothetical protein
VTIEDQNRPDDKPRGSAPANIRRVSDVIAENKGWVVAQWLQRVNANAELTRVSLSDAERRDHVPDLLDEAVARACGHEIEVEVRQRAAERHGTLRTFTDLLIALVSVACGADARLKGYNHAKQGRELASSQNAHLAGPAQTRHCQRSCPCQHGHGRRLFT